MAMRKMIKKLPIIKDMILQRDLLLGEMTRLREEIAIVEKQLSCYQELISKETSQKEYLSEPQGFPSGHFYSPIPSLQEIKENEDKLFSIVPRTLPGIKLNEEKQLENLHKLAAFYPEIPWSGESSSNFRFFFENPAFSYGDAITLFGMLRLLSPKRLIEVGSGYSSCVSLDVNEIYFSNQIDCTFIEPYPELLYSLIKEQDKERITILPKKTSRYLGFNIPGIERK